MATSKKSSAVADLVEKLFKATFERVRDRRSTEYKAGVRAILTSRAGGAHVRCPYATGTARADAFFAGVDEGRAVWRAYEEAAAAGATEVC